MFLVLYLIFLIVCCYFFFLEFFGFRFVCKFSYLSFSFWIFICNISWVFSVIFLLLLFGGSVFMNKLDWVNEEMLKWVLLCVYGIVYIL